MTVKSPSFIIPLKKQTLKQKENILINVNYRYCVFMYS